MNRKTIRFLEESIRFDKEKGMYHVGLPWRYGREKTAEILNAVDSKSMAVKRLRSLVPRLRRDEERRKMIFKSVNKWEEMGIAESVDELVDNQKAR